MRLLLLFRACLSFALICAFAGLCIADIDTQLVNGLYGEANDADFENFIRRELSSLSSEDDNHCPCSFREYLEYKQDRWQDSVADKYNDFKDAVQKLLKKIKKNKIGLYLKSLSKMNKLKKKIDGLNDKIEDHFKEKGDKLSEANMKLRDELREKIGKLKSKSRDLSDELSSLLTKKLDLDKKMIDKCKQKMKDLEDDLHNIADKLKLERRKHCAEKTEELLKKLNKDASELRDNLDKLDDLGIKGSMDLDDKKLEAIKKLNEKLEKLKKDNNLNYLQDYLTKYNPEEFPENKMEDLITNDQLLEHLKLRADKLNNDIQNYLKEKGNDISVDKKLVMNDLSDKVNGLKSMVTKASDISSNILKKKLDFDMKLIKGVVNNAKKLGSLGGHFSFHPRNGIPFIPSAHVGFGFGMGGDGSGGSGISSGGSGNGGFLSSGSGNYGLSSSGFGNGASFRSGSTNRGLSRNGSSSGGGQSSIRDNNNGNVNRNRQSSRKNRGRNNKGRGRKTRTHYHHHHRRGPHNRRRG